MASANYFNRRKAQVQNRDTGYTNRMFVAPIDSFTTINEPVAPFTNPGDNKTITTAHVFADGKGFLEIYCAQESVDAPGTSGGDKGSMKMAWAPVGFVPGDGADVQAMVEDMMNDDFVLILEDANCPGGPQIQFGCKCNPATVATVAYTSGTTATNGRKGYLVTFNSYCRFIYVPPVDVQPDGGEDEGGGGA